MNEIGTQQPQPFRVQLTRGQRGRYGWRIEVEGRDSKTVLQQVDDTDAHLREKYLEEKAPTARNEEATPPTAPPNVSSIFPKDLVDVLAFEEKSGEVIIRPRQFLGSDAFAKVAAIVKQHGGEYVSAGKDSHFKLSMAKVSK